MCQIQCKDIKVLFPKLNFWTEVLRVCGKYNFKHPQTREQVQQQIIWYNSHVKINGKCVVPNNNELLFITISDLLDDNGKWLSLERLSLKVNENPQKLWLLYSSIKKALPVYWRILLDADDPSCEPNTELCLSLETIKSKDKVSAFLLDKHQHYIFYTGEKLCNNCDTVYCYDEYIKNFANIYIIMEKVKLRNFQYRLLLNKIFTNNILAKWKIVQSEIDLCELCLLEVQTIQHLHLLTECLCVKELWSKMKECFKSEKNA